MRLIARSGGAPVTSDETAQQPWSRAADDFRRWLDGDRSGLDDLVRTLTPVLWHVVRAYGLPQHQSEDVVQSTWLTFVRKSQDIRDPQAVTRWLTMTARREAWRVAQASLRQQPVEDETLGRELPAVRDVGLDVLEADQRERLWAAVELLSPRCQRLLRVIAFDQRPDYGRLAADLGMPVGSIGPTRGRCLAKLKLTLSSDIEGSRA